MRDDFNENQNESNSSFNTPNDSSMLNNSNTFNESFAAKVLILINNKVFFLKINFFVKLYLEANALFGNEMG